jgi:hypothetical protein
LRSVHNAARRITFLSNRDLLVRCKKVELSKPADTTVYGVQVLFLVDIVGDQIAQQPNVIALVEDSSQWSIDTLQHMWICDEEKDPVHRAPRAAIYGKARSLGHQTQQAKVVGRVRSLEYGTYAGYRGETRRGRKVSPSSADFKVPFCVDEAPVKHDRSSSANTKYCGDDSSSTISVLRHVVVVVLPSKMTKKLCFSSTQQTFRRWRAHHGLLHSVSTCYLVGYFVWPTQRRSTKR